jgi:hypothetical protein
MRALGAGIIVLGFIAFWIFAAFYGIFDTGKRLAKKETRPEAVAGIKEGAKTTGKIAGGVITYYLLFFGGIFLLLVIIYGLGLG